MRKPNWSLVAAAKEAGGALSAAQAARILAGSDRAEELAAFSRRGYHFAQGPSGGLVLEAWPRRLFAEEIAADLGTDTVGRRVEVHWRVSSTNDLARREARRRREGTAVFSEEQVAGRGRFGRRWQAARFTSLLFSVPLLSVDGRVGPQELMLAGAVAVAEATGEVVGLSAAIRWPNDVLVEGRKVSGVLVEGLPGPGRDRWLVVGTGVNVNVDEADFPAGMRASAGSLSQFAGADVDRALLARSILRRLDFWWEVLKAGDAARLAAKCRRLSSILGTFVTLESQGKRHSGRVVDIDVEHGLVLQMDGGPTRVFAPSETTLAT